MISHRSIDSLRLNLETVSAPLYERNVVIEFDADAIFGRKETNCSLEDVRCTVAVFRTL